MKTVKKYWKPVLVVSAFFIGNRVFNHINAWLGISIIMLTVALKETVDAVANGRTLYIRGFGTLSPKHYKRKVARNIHKNETIVIAEHYTPHFKPAKSFKNRTKNL